jgi:hypothetical protein
MSFARKRARFSRKAEAKAMLREQQYNNQLYNNINSVTEILKRCEPEYKADITAVLIRQMFAMSFMALHDEFGFGNKRINDFMEKLQTLIDDYYDAYNIDTLIKFQMMLKERGITYKTTLDSRKEQK